MLATAAHVYSVASHFTMIHAGYKHLVIPDVSFSEMACTLQTLGNS